jgi:hypothetical protein
MTEKTLIRKTWFVLAQMVAFNVVLFQLWARDIFAFMPGIVFLGEFFYLGTSLIANKFLNSTRESATFKNVVAQWTLAFSCSWVPLLFFSGLLGFAKEVILTESMSANIGFLHVLLILFAASIASVHVWQLRQK